MINRIEKWLITKYQHFSQNNPGKCRLTPTCSTYALTALNRFGFFKGNFLILKRLFKCGFKKQLLSTDNVPHNIKGDFKWLI